MSEAGALTAAGGFPNRFMTLTSMAARSLSISSASGAGAGRPAGPPFLPWGVGASDACEVQHEGCWPGLGKADGGLGIEHLQNPASENRT